VVLVHQLDEPSYYPDILLSLAFLLWVIVFITGVIFRRYAGILMPTISATANLALLLAAILSRNATLTLPSPLFFGTASIEIFIDPLARWFMGIIGLVGIPIAIFSHGYLLHLKHRIESIGYIWAAMALLSASMAGVVLAANAVAFMVSWEIMAAASFLLVATDHDKKLIRSAAFIYLGATRTGTAFLMAGFLWAYHLTGSWSFVDWHISGSQALAPALLILVGLATKAGSWPFHLWLPIAHPAAPAPVSAIMSGLMIKTAIYAMVRFYIVGCHIDSPAIGPILLILGAISAFWGVIFALLQHDLKRLLGYHSVENIGIILMGLGMSLVGTAIHSPWIAQLGLAAALFHTLNHAVFKSLLFLGTGAVDVQTNLRDIEKLGGLIHRMPLTAGMFILGSAAICALPPLNGFASEWLLYKSFFSLAQNGLSGEMRMGGLLLMAWLALVGALAIACFVKAVGTVFLGSPRSNRAKNADEVGFSMRAGQIILAMLCIVLGLTAGPVLSLLSNIPAAGGEASQLGNAWSLPIVLLTLVIGLTLSLIAGLMWLHSKRYPSKRFITWDCGFGQLGSRTQYTATSFAQPISRMFGALYGYETKISVIGQNRRHFPEAVEVLTEHEPYLETRIYRPFLKHIQHLSGKMLVRLQAGSVHQYLFYMALVLALLLWVVVRR